MREIDHNFGLQAPQGADPMQGELRGSKICVHPGYSSAGAVSLVVKSLAGSRALCPRSAET